MARARTHDTTAPTQVDVRTMSDEELERYALDVVASDDYAPGVGPVDVTLDLRAIADAVDDMRRAEARVREAVELARASGRSWTRIAVPLGVTRQAARQRYGRDEG